MREIKSGVPLGSVMVPALHLIFFYYTTIEDVLIGIFDDENKSVQVTFNLRHDTCPQAKPLESASYTSILI